MTKTILYPNPNPIYEAVIQTILAIPRTSFEVENARVALRCAQRADHDASQFRRWKRSRKAWSRVQSDAVRTSPS